MIIEELRSVDIKETFKIVFTKIEKYEKRNI